MGTLANVIPIVEDLKALTVNAREPIAADVQKILQDIKRKSNNMYDNGVMPHRTMQFIQDAFI